MRRRALLGGAGAAALAAALAACADREASPQAASHARFRWKLVTSWAKNFPGLGDGAALLGELITRVSGGRLSVRVYGGGELVPPFKVFDAVARGTAEMGHSASYYWADRAPAAPLFSAVPFGFDAQEMNAWLHGGGGLALWRKLYARFDLVPFAAGNTGMQMAGWFRREIGSLSGLQGLRMRIPGLGGEVMARIGADPVEVAGTDIVPALERGRIDAAEWMGPHNDLAFGLHRAAKYYYYPGWQEPCATLECMVNAKAWAALPPDLQAVVEVCCRAVDAAMLADYTARNRQALERLVRGHGVELRKLPDDVLAALKRASAAVLGDLAAADPFARRVLDSIRDFRAQLQDWRLISDEAYAEARR